MPPFSAPSAACCTSTAATRWNGPSITMLRTGWSSPTASSMPSAASAASAPTTRPARGHASFGSSKRGPPAFLLRLRLRRSAMA